MGAQVNAVDDVGGGGVQATIEPHVRARGRERARVRRPGHLPLDLLSQSWPGPATRSWRRRRGRRLGGGPSSMSTEAGKRSMSRRGPRSRRGGRHEERRRAAEHDGERAADRLAGHAGLEAAGSSFEAPMNTASTASTRPRLSAGVTRGTRLLEWMNTLIQSAPDRTMKREERDGKLVGVGEHDRRDPEDRHRDQERTADVAGHRSTREVERDRGGADAAGRPN